MSRVHDALRRAEQSGRPANPDPRGAALNAPPLPSPAGAAGGAITQALLDAAQVVPWQPNPEAHLVDANQGTRPPIEEFRTLQTRLNHMQANQKLHSLVVTSGSPAEGKSFTAVNLALVQSQLQGSSIILCDFDFRRPSLHKLLRIERTPGLTDYLMGKASLAEVLRRIEGTQLYVIPAGSAVANPLELLNLKEVRTLLDRLPTLFNWVILDTPPLLFAADANLLATMCDGTLLVVRLGQTQIDSIGVALQGMSQNNVVGVVANGAKATDLYSQYKYYRYYYGDEEDEAAKPDGADEATPVAVGEDSEKQ